MNTYTSALPNAPAMNFTSDSIAGASPEILKAVVASNNGQVNSYGADELTAQVQKRFSEIFETDVVVSLVSTGTAANALSLSLMTPPWGTVLCHSASHICTDECGAPEFYTHGAKLVAVNDGPLGKVNVENLRAGAQYSPDNVHAMRPSCVSITQATEVGSVYSPDEVAALSEVCKEKGLPFHMDGSRFANALVSLDCSPADITWRAGIDCLSFGTTKNGTLGAEAIVIFNKSLASEIGYRRKRSGHLLSKMRFLSAQVDAYLTDDLWLKNARQANSMATRLIDGLKELNVEIIGAPEANIVFCRLPKVVADVLLREGFQFLHNRWGQNVVRLVTSYATTAADVDHLLTHIRDMTAHPHK